MINDKNEKCQLTVTVVPHMSANTCMCMCVCMNGYLYLYVNVSVRPNLSLNFSRMLRRLFLICNLCACVRGYSKSFLGAEVLLSNQVKLRNWVRMPNLRICLISIVVILDPLRMG